MQKTLSFLAGAVLGAMTGATLAVLFAPAPGKTIREDLRSRVQKVSEDMKQAAETRRLELEAQLANMQK